MVSGSLLVLAAIAGLCIILRRELQWIRREHEVSNAARRARMQVERDRQIVRQIAELPVSTEADD